MMDFIIDNGNAATVISNDPEAAKIFWGVMLKSAGNSAISKKEEPVLVNLGGLWGIEPPRIIGSCDEIQLVTIFHKFKSCSSACGQNVLYHNDLTRAFRHPKSPRVRRDGWGD